MIARLERSFEETRRFTADAAHEFRTPLAVIHNAAEVALSGPHEPDENRHFFEDILEEEERLKRLTEQLLFLCREDAGLLAEVREPVCLETIVRQATEPMGELASANGLTLTLGNLSACQVSGDPHGIRRLLFNLLDNAIKYTPEGGSVEVQCQTQNGCADLIVTDTGVGIPSEHIPHIFERFYRVDAARSREAGGTGLGLSICRVIAESHGGTIRLESNAGQGTRVVVTLPLLRANGQQAIRGGSI
jgi:signal transduction histidine kinase